MIVSISIPLNFVSPENNLSKQFKTVEATKITIRTTAMTDKLLLTIRT